MIQLGVNIDHVATVRQARKTNEPDPVWAAVRAELGGADQITVHLREDRRHIQDRDLRLLKETVTVRLNLECSLVGEMLEIACHTQPEQVCLVPEKREEVTTEGGLDLVGQKDRVTDAVQRLVDQGIEVSLFIDPDPAQIEAAKQTGAQAVELHTGAYANATGDQLQEQLHLIKQAGILVSSLEMRLNAGHGLTYRNVLPIAAIPDMEELNIGHSIIARSLMSGMKDAVAEMKALIVRGARVCG